MLGRAVISHYEAAAEGPPALVIIGGDAVVADMRVGEHDRLTGVGRVSEHFLVTRHDGVEDDLACRRVTGPGGGPVKNRTEDLALESRLTLALYEIQKRK